MITTEKSMAELWNSYLTKVVPPDAGNVQINETKLAFYAGARGLLWMIISNLDNGSEPSDNDMSFMDSLSRELEGFAKEVALREMVD